STTRISDGDEEPGEDAPTNVADFMSLLAKSLEGGKRTPAATKTAAKKAPATKAAAKKAAAKRHKAEQPRADAGRTHGDIADDFRPPDRDDRREPEVPPCPVVHESPIPTSPSTSSSAETTAGSASSPTRTGAPTWARCGRQRCATSAWCTPSCSCRTTCIC